MLKLARLIQWMNMVGPSEIMDSRPGQLPVCELENGHRNPWFTHWKWWFSIVFCMFAYRGYMDCKWCKRFQLCIFWRGAVSEACENLSALGREGLLGRQGGIEENSILKTSIGICLNHFKSIMSIIIQASWLSCARHKWRLFFRKSDIWARWLDVETF